MANEPTFQQRLTQLARDARRSVWRAAWVGGLPIAGTIAGVGGMGLIDGLENSAVWRTYFDFATLGTGAMWAGYALFYIPLWLVSLAIGVGLGYFEVRRRFRRAYKEARTRLAQTALAQLIVDDQVWEKLRVTQHGARNIQLAAVSGKHSAEDQVRLAAAHWNQLNKLLQSNDPEQSRAMATQRRYMGSSPMLAHLLGSIACAPVLGCPLNFGLSCLLGPIATFVAQLASLGFADYNGHLAGICDFMLGDADAADQAVSSAAAK